MKRSFMLTLLLLTALCVVTTGCGKSKNDTVPNNSTVQDTMKPPAQNNGNSLMDDVEQGLDNAGDAITGNDTYNNTNNAANPGVPYNEMLDNGTVTDHDGDLTNDTGTSYSMRKR